MTPQFPSSHLPDNQHVKFLCLIQWRIKSHLVAAHKKRCWEKVPTFAEVNRSNEEDWVEHKMTHDIRVEAAKKSFNESGNSSDDVSIAQVTKVKISRETYNRIPHEQRGENQFSRKEFESVRK